MAEDRAARFRRDGFLILPSLLAPAEARSVKEAVRDVLELVRREAEAERRDPRRAMNGGVYVGLSIRSETCRDLARDPRILDVLEEIYAPDIEFLSDKVVLKREGTDFGTPWHQDWPYWHGAHKISVWLALDDATIDNGCMKLLPGSHTASVAHDGQAAPGEAFSERIRPGAVDESREVVAAVPAGGAVFFHDLTLHASYPNATGEDRWAWVGTYRNAREEDLDYPWAVARAILRGSSHSLGA